MTEIGIKPTTPAMSLFDIGLFGGGKSANLDMKLLIPAISATMDSGATKKKLIDKYINDASSNSKSLDVTPEELLFLSNDRLMINPDGFTFLIWKIFIGCVITYIEIITAYQMAFSLEQPNFEDSNLISMIVFYTLVVIDNLLVLTTKFYEKGRLVTYRKAVIIHHMRKLYPLTFIPFIGIIYRIARGPYLERDQVVLQNILDFLFIYKMFDVFETIDKLSVAFKFSRKLIGLIYLINLLVKLIFLLHWATCIWIYILASTLDTQRLNFLHHFRLEGQSNIDIYVANLYWFMTTVSTVGFGEFYPMNFIERLYLSGLMIFSALFFGYLVNAVGKFMIQNQTQEISIKVKLAGINQEFKDK
jgi:hypothetical protein